MHRNEYPGAEKIYRKYLGENIPGLDVIQNERVAMIFSNSHYALTLPRPLPPDIVEIGGLHCKPGQKLPKDLDNFLSGAKDGFIYFSLGTVSLGKSMPEHVRQVFVKVFSKLKQRVLWKYETEEMPDLPKNVKLGKWLPQQDILAHPNIKIFITHGGLLSTQEASYHGTPLIGFPIGFDQDVNMVLAENSGYAIKMEILEITEEKLEAAIQQVLGDAKYIENARRVSSIIRDQLTLPMDRGIYWTEHIMKYKGAPYLRSASRDLNFIQFHLLDVWIFLIVVLASLLIVPFVIIRKCCCSHKHESREKVPREKKSK
jgi:glucuronosyltransferase